MRVCMREKVREKGRSLLLRGYNEKVRETEQMIDDKEKISNGQRDRERMESETEAER